MVEPRVNYPAEHGTQSKQSGGSGRSCVGGKLSVTSKLFVMGQAGCLSRRRGSRWVEEGVHVRACVRACGCACVIVCVCARVLVSMSTCALVHFKIH